MQKRCITLTPASSEAPSQAMLLCLFLSPIPGFIRKVFSRSASYIQRKGMFKLSNHSLQFATRSSELKLKPRSDWSPNPGKLCSHWLMFVYTRIDHEVNGRKEATGDENGNGTG